MEKLNHINIRRQKKKIKCKKLKNLMKVLVV